MNARRITTARYRTAPHDSSQFFFTTRALGAPNQKTITGKKEVAQLNSPPLRRGAQSH